jgi:hypothetical protein
MLITGDWFRAYAAENDKGHLLAGLRTVWLDELSLYRRIRELGELPTALGWTAYQADDVQKQTALRVVAEAVARNVDGFEPEIIIGFAGEANYLAQLWPNALRLHVERGQFGREPYPFSLYFDHVGTHGRSAIAEVARRKLTYPATADGRSLVSAFRTRMAAALGSLDPFRSHDFRGRFDRLCLLPLQVSNEFSFDGMVKYRTQFEYLYDVLAAAPENVGVIVTEHPGGEPVVRRSGPVANMGALRRAFPNFIFLDEFRRHPSSSQFLVPRVDGVWSVSSSVGYQALLFDRLVGSPTGTELCNLADATTLQDFLARLGDRKPVGADSFIAWLLERYLVPSTLLTDGRWFHDYLQRRLDAARAAVDPIDAFVATADADRLMDAWIVKAPRSAAMAFTRPEEDPFVAELRSQLHEMRRERDALLQSTSWRITAPLRLAKQATAALARRRRDRRGGAGSRLRGRVREVPSPM